MKKAKLFLLSCSVLGAVFFVASCDKGGDCDGTPPTYDGEMKAIIDSKCGNCHKVGGTAESSGVYTTYASMKPNFTQSWEEINAGRMPKTGSLTDAQKQAFECWKDAGFPEK